MPTRQQRGAYVPILIQTEATFKVTPSPASQKLYYVSEGVKQARNLISSKTMRGTRMPVAPMIGNIDISGDIPIELSPQHGRLLKHCLGVLATVGSSAPYTHTFSVGTLPAGLVIEKQFTDLGTPKFFLYNGCKVSTLKVAAKVEGPIDCTISVMGAKEAVNNSSFDPNPSDIGCDPFNGMLGVVSLNGAVLANVVSIDFSLENNLDGDTYVMDGTGTRRYISEGEAKVTGVITTLFEDADLYLAAINNTEKQLQLDLVKGLGTGASAGNEKLSFYFDEVLFKPESPVVQGPTGLKLTSSFEAYYNNDSDANVLRVVLLSPLANASFI
jgi:hypothetical protein